MQQKALQTMKVLDMTQSPPLPSKTALREAVAPGDPETPSYLILRCMSRPRYAALRLAARCYGGLPAWPIRRPSARLAGWRVAVRARRQPPPLCPSPSSATMRAG
jgi:hypothetical protein